MEFVRNRRKIRPINVVSLIDIIFTVILFFIIAGHIEKFSVIAVDLPKADSGQKLEEGPIVVLLGTTGEIIVNDEFYTDDKISAELKKQLSINPERIITIKADSKMEADKLVDFLEKIRLVGGKNLSLVTQSGEMAVTP